MGIEVYDLIFHRLQSSPNKWSKVHEASLKVRLFPALLGADTKLPNLSPDRYYASRVLLWISLGFKSIFYHFRNEQDSHVSTCLIICDREVKSCFEWSKRSDPFLDRKKLVPIKYEKSFVLHHFKLDERLFWKFIVIIMIIYSRYYF